MPDYKHTKEDLKIMQNWSLARKINVAQTRIMEWYFRHEGKCYVAFSGGKDSMVLLFLARRCFPDIPAVFVDTGLELPSVRQFALSQPNVTVVKPKMRFDEVVREYGWCYPSKDVATTIYYARKGSAWAINRLNGVKEDGTPSPYRQRIYAKWKHLLHSDFKISAVCCRIMKEQPLNKYVKETGNQPIIGTMATESERRKQAWLQTGCNSFDSNRPVSKPLSFFTEQDILRTLRDYDIPFADAYGDIIADKKGHLSLTGEKRTGCAFCPVSCHLDKVNRFQRLKQTHPKLYDYVIYDLGLAGLLDFVGVDYGREGA